MGRYKIRHVTHYTYEEPVRDSANQVMLYPIKDEFQEVINHHITITGNPQVAIFTDYYGNEIGTFTHPHPHRELIIDSKLDVVIRPRPLPEDTMSQTEQWSLLDRLRHQISFVDFLKLEPFHALPDMMEVIKKEKCDQCSPFKVANDFNTYVYNTFQYQKGITTVESTPDEIWQLRSGVCQDFAHILLFMLRLVHIPARYVSGYICPDKSSLRGEGATHAWVEAYIPTMGWIGLDPTNNCVVNDSHVRLAIGKNFTDCSPVRGTYRGTAQHSLQVTVSVQYDDGRSVKNVNDLYENLEPDKSFTRNSFRKHQEMQMQQ